MSAHSPVTIEEREWDGKLWWMVVASAAVHAAAIGLLLLLPGSFGRHRPPLASYTVDLVAPDRIGGNNLVPGGKARIEAAPAAAPVAPRAEPPPQVAKAKPPEPKPEPQKPAADKPAPQAVAQPEPEPQPPKPAEVKPKEADAVAVKKVEPAPAPTAVKPAPAPQAVAKAEPPKAQTKASPPVPPEAAAARARDERIAAAIKRVEQQMGSRGAGTGAQPAQQPGGPISVGPGEGAGGAVKGVQWLIYKNQLESRIKQNWAWAGSDRSLEAVVRFSISESGEVFHVRITHSSSDPTYDASVERAVKAANPLPPPPEAYRKEFGDVELTFTPASLER